MAQLIELIGIIALAVAIIQGLLVCASIWRKHKEETRLIHIRTSNLQKMASLTFQKAQQDIERQVITWSNWRKFEIKSIVQETKDIKSFYLEPHDQKEIPSFSPGQFLTFKLDTPSNPSVIRCYSLSDAPEVKGCYRITIKHIRSHNDNPAGISSSYFHEKLSEGDILNIKPPSGHFYLQREHQRPVVLIGGGIGVTPVLSMLNSICEIEPSRETWFFYGVKNSDERINIDQLRKKEQECENLHVIICHSAPLENEREGQDYDAPERISVELFKRTLPSNNYQFYICGPSTMMSSLIDQLSDWKVPDSDILFEAFGPSSMKKMPASPENLNKSFSVIFAKSGITTHWTADKGSLLELAEAEGLSPEAGCRAGNCGTCITAVKEGDTDYITPAGAIPEEGSCLLCVCKPKGDIVLDV